jgi:hypothetical protein
VDPDSFNQDPEPAFQVNPDTDPVPNPDPGLKGRPNYRRSLQPSKENNQHLQKMKFTNCFLHFRVIFALMDPGPIQIWIGNTGEINAFKK